MDEFDEIRELDVPLLDFKLAYQFLKIIPLGIKVSKCRMPDASLSNSYKPSPTFIENIWFSKDFIHCDKLFDLLASVGALTKEISILVRELEEKARKEKSINETN